MIQMERRGQRLYRLQNRLNCSAQPCSSLPIATLLYLGVPVFLIQKSCRSFGIRHSVFVHFQNIRDRVSVVYRDNHSLVPLRDFGLLIQVVHFHERNSGGVVYPTHDGGVVTRWEVCDDRRFARVRRSVAAVLNVLDLVAG